MKIRNSLIFSSIVFAFVAASLPHASTMPSANEASEEDGSTDADEATPKATPAPVEPHATPAKTEMPSAAPATHTTDNPEAMATPAAADPAIETTQFQTIELEGNSGKPLSADPANPTVLQDLSKKVTEVQASMQTSLDSLEKTRTTCQETFHTVASPLDTLLPQISSLIGKYEKQVPSSNP